MKSTKLPGHHGKYQTNGTFLTKGGRFWKVLGSTFLYKLFNNLYFYLNKKDLSLIKINQ